MAGVALTASPSSFSIRIDPHMFRGDLVAPSSPPCALSVRQCRCGRSIIPLAIIELRCVRESGGSGKTGIRHRERGHACVGKEVPGLPPT